MAKTIAFVINRFDRMGGGERLIQEGARYYRSIGHRVLIITWHYDGEVSFNDEYENLDIISLEANEIDRSNILKRAAARASSLPRLRKILKQHNVSTVFVQGEYDVALIYVALLFSGIPYRFLIFGQMYQYPHDNAKYSLIFRRHLEEIAASCQGYDETTPRQAPKLSLINRGANEIISLVRYFAVRSAQKRFTFSRQLDWETGLLYNMKTIKARGAFRRDLLDAKPDATKTLQKLGLQQGRYILSVSRLDRKKRIDVAIKAFARAGLDDDMMMVVGGAGPDEALLKKAAKDCKIDHRVKFVGLVDEDDLIPLKFGCAVFVSMDIGDYDISPLEALAIGRPAICSSEFDLDPALEACPDFHICKADPDILAKMLDKVLSQPKQTCKEHLDALTWESYFDSLLEA